MKRTILALAIAASALSGCVSTEQLWAQCDDRATLAGAEPTPKWMEACTRELTRQYNERAAAEFSQSFWQSYTAAQVSRPRTCIGNRIGTSTFTNCY